MSPIDIDCRNERRNSSNASVHDLIVKALVCIESGNVWGMEQYLRLVKRERVEKTVEG